MLDFRENSEGIAKGYVKTIENLADAQEFVSNVHDMGMGIMLINLVLSEDYDVRQIRKRIATNKRIHRICTPASLLGFGLPSIDHLGGDGCYVGIIESGAGLKNEYRLIIASYDAFAASKFNECICRIIDKQATRFKKRGKNPEELLTAKIHSGGIAENHDYQRAIRYGRINRRAIAAHVLGELDIRVSTEKMKLGNDKTITVISNDSVTLDYPTVFIEKMDDGRSLLHCHAYRLGDIYSGAPWCIHEPTGFNCYSSDEKDVPMGIQNKWIAAPLGNKKTLPQHVDKKLRDDEISRIIRKKALWNIDIDIMLICDPKDCFHPERATNTLETQFHLRDFRRTTWRTEIIFFATPRIQEISIEKLLFYTITDAVTLHYMRYMQVVQMWCMIRNKYEQKQKSPSSGNLPCITEIFHEESSNKKYISVSKKILKSLLKEFEVCFGDAEQVVHPPSAIPSPSNTSPPPDDPKPMASSASRPKAKSKRPAKDKVIKKENDVSESSDGCALLSGDDNFYTFND